MASLQMIFGCAGSGKTWQVRKMAAELGKLGKSVLLLVPEQFVFETERALLEDAGPSFALNIEVISFSRMAQRCDGGGLPLLDGGARQLLVFIALREIADQLEFYSRQALRPSFAKTAAGALTALKAAGLNASDLRKLARSTKSDRLKAKLGDMAFLMDAYDALTVRRFEDSDNAMQRLAAALEHSNPYAGRTVIFDSFKGFTETEYKIIDLLMADASETVFTLPADRAAFERGGRYKLFANVAAVALRLRQLAEGRRIPELPPLFLEDNHRFTSPDIAYAEAAWRGLRNGEPPKPEHIVLTACTSPSRESAVAAMRIHELVREQGLRYRDIMLILREPSHWKGILDHALNQAGIPFFWGVRKSLAESPVCKFLLHALACTDDFSADNLLKYVKTYLCGLSEDEVFEIENYIFLHPMAGKQWQRAWPESVEPLRRRLVEPLLALRQSLKDCDGKGFAQALYQFMLTLDIPSRVEELDVFAQDARLESRVTDQRRAYNAMVELLEQFAGLTEHYAPSLPVLTELFANMADASTLGEIPQVLDSVQVGGADLVRPGWGVRAVLILGANEGIFPEHYQEVGPFSGSECKELSRLGSPVTRPLEEQVGNERLLAYQALFSASEYLFVSYSDQSMAAESLSPSVLVTELQLLFKGQLPLVREESLPFIEKISAIEPALAEMASASPTEKASLTQWMLRHGQSERIRLIEAAARRSYRIVAPEGSRLLFGDEFKAFPSSLEQFAKCRFSFYCRYGLHAEEDRPQELNSLEYGSALHYILEKLFTEYTPDLLRKMKHEELLEKIKQLLTEYSALLFVELPAEDAKAAYFAGRLSMAAAEAVQNICDGLLAGSFVPVAFELPIGQSGGLEPLSIQEKGVRASLVGKIDRVDQFIAPDGKKYLRIIDYKTGEIGFSEKKLQFGLNLQLVYYLDTLCRQTSGPFAGSLPAGILYVPLRDEKPRLSSDATPEAVEKERAKARKMEGLVLDDPKIVRAMESTGSGKYIPVSLKADGDINRQKKGALKTPAEFESLFELAEQQVRKMAGRIAEGDFWAYPLNLGYKGSSCRFCAYESVCLRDAGDPMQTGDESSQSEGGEAE